MGELPPGFGDVSVVDQWYVIYDHYMNSRDHWEKSFGHFASEEEATAAGDNLLRSDPQASSYRLVHSRVRVLDRSSSGE